MWQRWFSCVIFQESMFHATTVVICKSCVLCLRTDFRKQITLFCRDWKAAHKCYGNKILCILSITERGSLAMVARLSTVCILCFESGLEQPLDPNCIKKSKGLKLLQRMSQQLVYTLWCLCYILLPLRLKCLLFVSI